MCVGATYTIGHDRVVVCKSWSWFRGRHVASWNESCRSGRFMIMLIVVALIVAWASITFMGYERRSSVCTHAVESVLQIVSWIDDSWLVVSICLDVMVIRVRDEMVMCVQPPQSRSSCIEVNLVNGPCNFIQISNTKILWQCWIWMNARKPEYFESITNFNIS